MAVALKLNFYVWLPQYIDDEDFEILEVENVYEEDLHLFKIKYNYEPKVFNPDIPLRNGEIFLLPDHNWVIKKGNFELVEPEGKPRLNVI